MLEKILHERKSYLTRALAVFCAFVLAFSLAVPSTQVFADEQETQSAQGVQVEAISANLEELVSEQAIDAQAEITLLEALDSISSASDWEAFVASVNGGETYEGKIVTLQSDIDLSSLTNQAVLGSASNPFKGVFEGSAHTISGINISGSTSYLALFGYNAGTIQNFTAKGSVTNTNTTADGTDFVAGVVAFNAGTISGVTNKVTVNASSSDNVGGIAGFSTSGTWVDSNGATQTIAGATGKISECSNLASVLGYKKVGGIVGENAGAISSCNNKATVDAINNTKKNGVGGIAGRNGNNNDAVEVGTIDACYNKGTIGRSGQKWVGGIAGLNNKLSSISNSYNVGAIASTQGYANPIVGNQEASSASNNYSLDTVAATGTSEIETGMRKTEAELKSASMITLLGSNYIQDTQNANSGWPLLSWESSLAPSPAGYTVSYDLQGHGSAIASETVSNGDTATKPADPTAEGYIFGGWYTDAGCTDANAFDFTAPITADITLYAKWTADDSAAYFTVKIYAADGSLEKTVPLTKSEFEGLATTTDPVVQVFFKNYTGSDMQIFKTENYVPLSNLLSRAGYTANDDDKIIVADSTNYVSWDRTYKQLTQQSYYWPKMTYNDYWAGATSEVGKVATEPVLALSYIRQDVGAANGAITVEDVAKNLSDTGNTDSCPRWFVGAADTTIDEQRGNRSIQNVCVMNIYKADVETEIETVPMYRAYNPNSGEHFFTQSMGEINNLVSSGWRYEDIGWYAPTTGKPVYRLYSGTDHHYTTDVAEYTALLAGGWKDEGLAWYSYEDSDAYTADTAKQDALLRVFNPNVVPTAPTNNSGSHHYTRSQVEVDNLVKAGWTDERLIGWYGVKQS